MPNARRLVLNLLLVAEAGFLTVADAVKACALFDITENSVRVTLARLSQAGLIESVERGAYRLTRESRRFGADVSAWRTAEDRLRPWQGGWIAVATGGLPRSDRKVLRARERALSMLGLRELDKGLHLRPDNFVGGVGNVRQRLLTLGLGADAAVFEASNLDERRERRARALWPTERLEEGYAEGCRRLDGWLDRSSRLPLETAARESFVIGDDAIHQLVFDPMLPSPLVDEAKRHAFVAAVKRFDAAGREIWARFLNSAGHPG